MIQIMEPKTRRLQLRQWVASDRKPFAAMSADPQVMKYFPAALSRSESDAVAQKCEALIAERGWGVWAVELLETGDFIGLIGLNVPRSDLPCSPCVEVLWRLARPYWGHGYATEGAAAALRAGFEQLDLHEIVSFAVTGNHRSREVMKRLHMVDTGETFQHPEVSGPGHLREHCLYRITRAMYESEAPPGR